MFIFDQQFKTRHGLVFAASALLSLSPLVYAPIAKALPRSDLASAQDLQVETLEVGQVKVVKLKGLATKVFVGNTKVAAAKPNNGTSIVIVGTEPGNTDLLASNEDGDIVGRYYVVVTAPGGAARVAASEIRQNGQSGVSVQKTANGARLYGDVDTPLEANEAYDTALKNLPQGAVIRDDINIRESAQVNLRVRIVEMSRTLTRALGVNWKNLGGDIGSFAKLGMTSATSLVDVAGGATQIAASFRNTDVLAVIDAMSKEQIIRTLAQPDLTTVSGQPANFLVGGEFPIPMSSNLGQISVQFKTYGISLSFLPTVLSSGQINLKVRPEVSYLTDQGAVNFKADGGGTLSIPALAVRRAETTVQLGSGESFAVAGLLRDVATSSNTLTPFLGEIPVLGALFRSDSFKHEQTELVIIVTPYIVKPVANSSVLHTPDENFKGVNEADNFLTFNGLKTREGATVQRSHTKGLTRSKAENPMNLEGKPFHGASTVSIENGIGPAAR